MFAFDPKKCDFVGAKIQKVEKNHPNEEQDCIQNGITSMISQKYSCKT
jgi:hypothetical protein